LPKCQFRRPARRCDVHVKGELIIQKKEKTLVYISDRFL
jgi:hypothetical protein